MSRLSRRTEAGAPAGDTPAAQVAGFIARFDPPVARLLRAARRALRQRFPTAVELVYDNYNALAIGWAGSERASDVIVSVAGYARGVSLYFTHGARLPDPTGRLEGQGKQGRFVRLTDTAILAQAAIVALLDAATRDARTPLPQTGRGRTVVKSISARQRPRRSAAPVPARSRARESARTTPRGGETSRRRRSSA
jgi:hypothetical protein